MKYLWLLFPLSFVGCSSVKFVTVDYGRIVTKNNQFVNIVGNPPMVCHYRDSLRTYSGYYMYKIDGAIVLDNFGRGIIQVLDSATCKLGLE